VLWALNKHNSYQENKCCGCWQTLICSKIVSYFVMETNIDIQKKKKMLVFYIDGYQNIIISMGILSQFA
jgi:hypothetical protein